MHRPPSIIWFERYFLGSVLVSIVSTMITWNELQAEIQRDAARVPSSAASGLTIVILLISLAIVAALWYSIARRASNIGKWIYVVLTAIGVLMTIATLFEPTNFSGLALAASLLSTALSVVSAIYLFRADAVAWLTGKPPVDPGVFS